VAGSARPARPQRSADAANSARNPARRGGAGKGTLADVPEPTSPPDPTLPACGPYRARRVIGRGASSTVYLAEDRRSRRVVALKVLAGAADAGDGDDSRARFLAQADAARRLEHPDIVALIDAGDSPGGPWLALELVHGCELTRYTRPPRLLPEAIVCSIGERIARALAHAHAQGIVHRDLKPGNVLIDLPTGRLKLADFGIAGLADASRTRTGVVLGTPLYMAPEQLAGAPADARADLYALGVVLFELLSGARPHEHDSLGELLRRVAHAPAPDLRALQPRVEPALATLVARCLHKQPGARPADAGAVADALARIGGPGRTGAALHNRALFDGSVPLAPCR
jgi:serine/threonine-protein kinase